MHQPISITIPADEYKQIIADNKALLAQNQCLHICNEDLLIDNDVLTRVIYDLESILTDYEERPETVYADILEVKKEVFPICKRMLYIASKFAKRLSKSENVRKLHDDLLDMYNEVKYDERKKKNNNSRDGAKRNNANG